MGLVDALAAIDRQQQYDAMEQELLGARDPDALERLDADLLRQLAGEEAQDDLEQLRELTRALEEAGYLERDGGRLELTPRAARKLGMRALTDIFSRLRRESLGGHPLPSAGGGGEPTDETKRFEHGDAFAVDLNRTLFNAMARNGPGTPVRLAPDDFEVRRTEETTVSSTVLLLDMSRSMLLRGCSTAAKRVAMALHTLIHTKYPRDRLYVVGFAYYARQIKPEAIATLSPYEFEYGTNLQHALMIARQLLGRRSGGNKEIVVITDGEPTAHIANGQVEFAYPPTIRTMQSTLREVGPGDEGGDRDQHLHAGTIPLPVRVRRPDEPHQPRPRLLRRAGAPGRVRPGRLRQPQDQARRLRMTRPLKVGVQLPEVEYVASLAAAARDGADRRGDRARLGLAGRPPALPREDAPPRGPWEAWTTLTAIAAVTERVQIGPLVACTSFHNPAMLAKKAATLDEISGGRLILGLGAGWNEAEYSAFGFPYDHRVSRFEEAFTIIRTLLRDGPLRLRRHLLPGA